MRLKQEKRIPAYGKLRNFIIDADLDQRLSTAAEDQKCSVSSLIRRFCHEGLNRDNSSIPIRQS